MSSFISFSFNIYFMSGRCCYSNDIVATLIRAKLLFDRVTILLKVIAHSLNYVAFVKHNKALLVWIPISRVPNIASFHKRDNSLLALTFGRTGIVCVLSFNNHGSIAESMLNS